MKIQPINNNYKKQSFNGKLLRNQALEKHIAQLNSTEFDAFVKHVDKMESVKDGKLYEFFTIDEYKVPGNIRYIEANIRDVFGDKPDPYKKRVIEKYKVFDENGDGFYFDYSKKNADCVFEQIWEKYPIETETELNDRKNKFLDSLDI